MAGNATPNYTKNGNFGSTTVTAANTKSDGAGTVATDIFKAFTADATNGSYVERIDWIATATAAATTTTATIGRAFISSVGSSTTASTNTFLIGEVALPAVSADSSTTAVNLYSIPVGFRIPAGWFIHVTNHAAPAASTAWRANVIGGDY